MFAEETRGTGRVAVEAPVILEIDTSMESYFRTAQKEIQGVTIDVSPTGMSVFSDIYIPEGVLVIVNFRENNEKIKGEVVSCRMAGGRYRIGIFIKELTEEAGNAIKKFIERGGKGN